MIVKIRQASNGGVQVCIPKEIQSELDISKGDYVEIKSEGAKIVISKLK